jgi:predicted Zn finger-like uncharacterized protein
LSLITRCAACATAFRVQPGQLSARGGKVRCGRCGTVFDGIAQLFEESAETVIEPSPQYGLFDPSRQPPAPEAAPDSGEAIPELAGEVVFLAPMARPSRAATLFWGLAAALALTALAAQAGMRYRSELGVLAPSARPYLEHACRLAGCRMRLPHRPELLSIESSELQADPRRDNVIQLSAVIRNRAPFPQEYPALELTLIDDNEAPVVRRVLQPGDYLDPRRVTDAGGGMGGESEATLRVLFDSSRVRATGYRLYLFYP